MVPHIKEGLVMNEFEEMDFEKKKYIVFQLHDEEFAIPVS